MTALKLRRHAHKAKDDNLVDAHGYLLCAEWIEKGSPPTPEAHAHLARAEELMQCIESIAIGEKLTCPKCEQLQPCMCGHN